MHYCDALEDNKLDTSLSPEEVLERTKATVNLNTSVAATLIPNILKRTTPSKFLWEDEVLQGNYASLFL